MRCRSVPSALFACVHSIGVPSIGFISILASTPSPASASAPVVAIAFSPVLTCVPIIAPTPAIVPDPASNPTFVYALVRTPAYAPAPACCCGGFVLYGLVAGLGGMKL